MSKIDLVIESCFENIDLIGTCIESLSSELLDEHQRYQLKISVYEAVTNCIKHAYLGSPRHTVLVACNIDSDRILLDIADSGISMDPKYFNAISTAFEINPDNPKEGGMGLKIIKLYMDSIDYQTKDGTNHFILVKYSKPPITPQEYSV